MAQLTRSFYAGVFLLSIGMLAAQFLLTRFLSIVFWYHFVFLIISMVMFGLTLGTLIIYFFPKAFPHDKTIRCIGRYSILSGLSILLTYSSLFYLPGFLATAWKLKMAAIVNCFFPILVIPFVLMGVAFSLILTRFPQEIGKIYGVNLIGSASGCLAAYFILNIFNGPSVMFILTAIFLIAAGFFLQAVDLGKGFRPLLLLVIVCLGAVTIVNQQTDAIQINWSKNQLWKNPIYSKWNFFSYVTVRRPSFHPFGWGYSQKVWGTPIKAQELMILIDEGAGTVLTLFSNPKNLDYLNMDTASLAYRIRPPQTALVIGSGGGRDLLTAAINGTKRIIGIELNRDIIDIALSVGMLQKFPQIEIHNDDGRSYLAHSKERYDLIQASLVDSFAAASSGAFALSENSLYTVDAWSTYLDHLTPTGVLTFSRWHHKQPSEIYRLLTMTKQALRELGLTDYRRHILLARAWGGGGAWPDVGTILISKAPFTDQEVEKFRNICDELKFDVILTKDKSSDPVFDAIFEQSGDRYHFSSVKGNIDPPTDNKPFYFYFSDFKNFFKELSPEDREGPRILKKVTFLIVGIAAFFCLVTFFLTQRMTGHARISIDASLYFSFIGLAFMFIEIPLIQRLGIFLGHPVYGLNVVLFGLLLACGLGSMCSPRVGSIDHFQKLSRILLGFIILLAFGWPVVLKAAAGVSIPIKIFLSFLAVASIGFLMGFPFPFAASQVSRNPHAPLIFYWAVNGFTSMCGSAFATVILINLGYMWAIMIGFAFYALAFGLLKRLSTNV